MLITRRRFTQGLAAALLVANTSLGVAREEPNVEIYEVIGRRTDQHDLIDPLSVREYINLGLPMSELAAGHGVPTDVVLRKAMWLHIHVPRDLRR